MTEAEWWASEEEFKMLLFISQHNGNNRRKAGRRKLRLYGCASCRYRWEQMTDVRSRHAVEVAERLADGLAHKSEVEQAGAQAVEARRAMMRSSSKEEYNAAFQASSVLDPRAGEFACPVNAHHPRFRRHLANALRCIFGNPFQPVVCKRGWRTRDTKALAAAIYEERTYDRLPILADALEDAGCDHADVLNHCRQPGEHVRGCWVVDLVLGKS